VCERIAGSKKRNQRELGEWNRKKKNNKKEERRKEGKTRKKKKGERRWGVIYNPVIQCSRVHVFPCTLIP